jgi:hypothetical protein
MNARGCDRPSMQLIYKALCNPATFPSFADLTNLEDPSMNYYRLGRGVTCTFTRLGSAR